MVRCVGDGLMNDGKGDAAMLRLDEPNGAWDGGADESRNSIIGMLVATAAVVVVMVVEDGLALCGAVISAVLGTGASSPRPRHHQPTLHLR